MSTSADAAALADHINAISRLLRQSIESRAQHLPVPLTPPQVLAMETLVEADREGVGLSLSDLSDRMGLAHSTVSGIVTRLEQRALVCRTTWADDRRQRRIQLTDAVRTWVSDDLPRLRQQSFRAALDQLGAEQTAALVGGLALLRQHLETPDS